MTGRRFDRVARVLTRALAFVPTTTMLVVALMSMGGCGPDFDPYFRLASLRVLAVKSEPAAPGPGETAMFEPLVYSVDTAFEPDPSITYEWSWCPFPGPASDGYPCLVGEDEIAMWTAAGGGSIPSLNLGTQRTAMFAHNVDPGLLATLCRGNPNFPISLDCSSGFPIQVRVKVTSANDTVDVVQTLYLRFDEATMPPNANPIPTTFTASVDNQDQPLAPEAPPSLLRNRETEVRVHIADTDAEMFTSRDGVAAREKLTFAWFVDAGNIDERRTGPFPVDPEVAARFPEFSPLENKWAPGGMVQFPNDIGHVVAVVRDDRGGVGWIVGSARLEPAR